MDPSWKASWSLERVIGSGDGNSPLADRVNALCFSLNGKELFTGGGEPTRGGEIKCWRVKDGSFIREFQNVHSDSVLALNISPDGKQLASGSADRLAKTVELATGKVLKIFEGHTHQVLGVAWKRDTRMLMTAGADNVAKTWDAATGERRKNIEGFGKEITAAAFVGVGDEAVLSAGDGQVVLMKANGEKVRSFLGASDYVYATAATADGAVVVAGGADGILRVWDGKTAKVLTQF
jgi:WD40 repeat protein